MPSAFYVKLGRGGVWEADSIASSMLRIGWHGQTVEDINARRWDRIAQQLRDEQPDKPGVVTTDLNRLRDVALSDSADVWITFHAGKLWWTHLADSAMEQDALSKFRRTQAWRDRSCAGRLLVTHELPGRIAQLQGFRGTICRVSDAALLARVLSGTEAPLAQSIRESHHQLQASLAAAIRELHWKDFETLVDLVFRQAGWRRDSILGQQVKGYDLALREPLTQRRALVQVKSRAGASEMERLLAEFSAEDFEHRYLVVHSPEASLTTMAVPEGVECVGPDRLATLSIDAGLTDWLRDKMA